MSDADPHAAASPTATPPRLSRPPAVPLCELPIAPNFKKAISDALGGRWDNAPPAALHPRMLVAALDGDSHGLTAVLQELGTDRHQLRTAATAALKIAS